MINEEKIKTAINKLKSFFIEKNDVKRVKSSQTGSSNSSINRLERFDEIPDFQRLVFDNYVNEKEQLKRFALLEKSGSSNEIYLVYSEGTGARNIVIDLKRKLQKDGKKICAIYVAKSTLVDWIYEQEKKRTSADNDVEKKGFRKLFHDTISNALKENASDVHIEVMENKTLVRFRVDGILHNADEWSVEVGKKVSSVVYQVDASQKEISFNPTLNQAARIDAVVDGISLGMRLQTVSKPSGFDVIIRLLKTEDDGKIPPLNVLGYSPMQLNLISKALRRPVGLILMIGTTGSGKTTTIASMLNTIVHENMTPNGLTLKIITAEDPTEYVIKHITQHSVNRNKEYGPDSSPFADAMNTLMRCDPDIFMLGETRDKFSAAALQGGVQSGHTAFSTTHASSGFGALKRLRSFGIADDVLGSLDFISALIYQTLVPKNCEHCKIPYVEWLLKENKSEKELDLINRFETITTQSERSSVFIRNQHGCNHCRNCGLKGRTVVAEVVMPSVKTRYAIEQRNDSLATYYFLKEGGKLIKAHALEKVLSGTVCLMEAEKAVGDLDDQITAKDLAESLGINDNDDFIDEKKINEVKNKSISESQDIFSSTLLSEKKNESNNIVVFNRKQDDQTE